VVIRLPLAAQHWNLNTFFSGSFDGLVVTGIDVPRHAQTRIVGQYSIQTLGCVRCAIGDGDLACVQRIANANSATVMK
jgi:hypothetical protein